MKFIAGPLFPLRRAPGFRETPFKGTLAYTKIIILRVLMAWHRVHDDFDV
jgi:hypothetical protein